MFKAENFGETWLDLVFPFPCEIHHCRLRAKPDSNRFVVLIHYMEPRQLKWPIEFVRECHGQFDLILTNEEDLLDLPNARFCLFGSSWIATLPERKSFDVSFLYSNGIGAKALFSGYRDRHCIWARRHEILVPMRFYTSIKRPPEGVADLAPYPYPDKSGLFESMFSVIIENAYENNFFTEKLIDSLRSFTVPIYFGAPNIGKYFDIDGMILPTSIDEAVDMINQLTPEDYWDRIAAIERNYRSSKYYWNALERLRLYIEDGKYGNTAIELN